MSQDGSPPQENRSKIFFLNGHVGKLRTGIENAALLRAVLFEKQLIANPVICTVHYEPHFPEVRKLLVARDLASPTLQFKNLFDDLQGIDSNYEMADLEKQTLRSLPQLITEGGRAEQILGCLDIRICDARNRPIAYCKYSEDHDCLQHVNYLHAGRVWKRDTYHSSETLSRTQFIDPTTRFTRHEIYFNREQQIVLTKFYAIVDGKLSTAKIILYPSECPPIEFSSEGALVLHWLRELVKHSQERVVFLCDRIRLFAEPLSQLMSENSADRVAVVPILHALHTKSARAIRGGPINANYASVLRDVRQFPTVVVGTEQQRLDVEARFNASNVRAIPPGYCKPQAPAVNPSRELNKIVYIARYGAEKRHHLAIEIFSRVLRECPNAKMEFYGSGKRMQKIADDVNARNLGHVIAVHGFTQNPTSVYATSGLSILTSQGEGFALGVLESLAAGCPVISFNVPYGPADIIEDGQNGVLIPEGDVDAFARRVVQILRDEDLHHRLIHNCLPSIDRFSVAAVAAQWRVLLSSAIGESSK